MVVYTVSDSVDFSRVLNPLNNLLLWFAAHLLRVEALESGKGELSNIQILLLLA